MIWLIKNWRIALSSAVLILIVGMAVAIMHYRYLSVSVEKERDEAVQQRNSAQSIASNAIAAVRLFNDIAAANQQQADKIRHQSDQKVIEYRTILHREKTCDLPVPDDVAHGLLDYTNRIRAGALPADTGITDGADHATAATAATGTLTYCQAVLWINPLLAEIEKANSRFSDIRKIESSRAPQ